MLQNKRIKTSYKKNVSKITKEYNKLIHKKNHPIASQNGIYTRWKNPVLTREHVPLFWRYDYDYKTNPYFIEKLRVNSVFNSGAIYRDGRFFLVARVEGVDRKSFFAVAESKKGHEGFKFRDYPMMLPDIYPEETNIYDMRLTQHEDGYIYGVFCSESKDMSSSSISSAIAQGGIVRTKDLKEWERLPNIVTQSKQQRNLVLHPELINGKYAFFYPGTGGIY